MSHQKWTIWRANLDPVVGSQQGHTRPVLIISDDSVNELINTVNVIPLATRKPNRQLYSNEVLINKGSFGLLDDSILLCHQISILDKKRFAQFYGEINDLEIQNEIIEAILFQLGIECTNS